MARIDARNERALESLREVDRQVAKIVEALRSQGELGSTYLVFTSDNGYLDGEHRVEFGKLLPYDPSSKVPLLVRGPGVATDTDSNALVGNIDLAPSILDLVGRLRRPRARRPPTARPAGRTVEARPPAAGDRVARPRPLHLLRLSLPSDPHRPLGSTSSTRPATASSTTSKNDPQELDWHATDPNYTATIDYLAKALDRLQDCQGAQCRARVGPVPAPQTKNAK